MANLLAHHAAQSQAFPHRGRTSHLHSFDGRNRGDLFPPRPRQYSAARNLGSFAPRHHAGNQRHLHPDFCSFRSAHRHLVSHTDAQYRIGSAALAGKTLGGSMSHSRRNFIKFVVAGSVASGCPVDAALIPSPDSTSKDSKSTGAPRVEGEHFEICHQVRDGHHFDHPSPKAKADVVIVGGGVAGLSAAYFLRGKDWLLLEKEEHFGGNAYQEEYEGQIFGTGSAYGYRGDAGDVLAKEIGVDMPLVNMPDPVIDNGKFGPDIWRTGIEHLPYPKKVVESFKKFRDDVIKINPRKNMAALDLESFDKYTAPYAPELRKLLDAYGPSNWGAFAEDTSAFIGLLDAQLLFEGLDDQRVILPGGLGCI